MTFDVAAIETIERLEADLSGSIAARNKLAEMYQDSERRLTDALNQLVKIRNLQEFAVTQDEFGTVHIVESEGFESRTFFDADAVREILESTA